MFLLYSTHLFRTYGRYLMLEGCPKSDFWFWHLVPLNSGTKYFVPLFEFLYHLVFFAQTYFSLYRCYTWCFLICQNLIKFWHNPNQRQPIQNGILVLVQTAGRLAICYLNVSTDKVAVGYLNFGNVTVLPTANFVMKIWNISLKSRNLFHNTLPVLDTNKLSILKLLQLNVFKALGC